MSEEDPTLAGDAATRVELLDLVQPRVAEIMRLILRIAGGDFSARGTVSRGRDELDGIVVGLNMLAETFELERNLRARAEALLADTLDAYEDAPGLFCSLDAETLQIVKCNQTLADAVGMTKAELHSRTLLDLCDPASRGELDGTLRCMLDGALAPASEAALLRSDGTPMTVSIAGSIKHGPDGRPLRLRLLLRDVTTERELEDQLLHSQKMEAVGQLAGGVAHDFNNLLLVIRSGTALLESQLADGGIGKELLAEVVGAVDRASELTRQLLTFARREPTRPRVVDLAELVRGQEAVLRRLLAPSIGLAVRLPPGHVWVRADPAQLEQALMNLVINAKDAMTGAGQVEIELLDEEAAADAPGERAGDVCLAVQDTGPGVAPEHRARVFEPFFTTKPAGRGTGLGLATVYGIATRAGGEVRLAPGATGGARFEVWLPRSDVGETLPPAPAPASAAGVDARGSEKVLVVEDEGAVRRVITLVLEQAGYDVVAVDSAEEALALADGLIDEIDLVLTDVLMPSMPGNALVERLRVAHPGLRCLFISGYPAEESTGDDPFLAKPFAPDDLLALVRSTIGR